MGVTMSQIRSGHRLLATAALVIAGLLTSTGAQCTPTKIVIIRHGEKPDTGENLSCQGLNRALALPAVLMKKFGKPDHTYVPALKMGQSTNHARMFQTVTPFAVQQNLAIDSAFGEKKPADVAQDVLRQSGLVLLVWEHTQIHPLAKALGVKNPPEWQKSDFDSIWIVTPAKSGHAKLDTDSEGISPSPQCPT